MPVLMFAVLCLIWGSTWIAIKIGLADAPPLWAAALRFALAVAVIGTFVRVKRFPVPATFRGLLRMGHPGLYMYCLSYALVYWSELYINSALAAVLFGSFPFFVALLSHFALKHEPMHRAGWFGLLLGFAGVVLISYDSLQASGELFFGSMLALAGSLASAFGLMIHKRNFAKANIYVAALVQMSFGGTLLLLGALVLEDIDALALSAKSVGSILYLALFGTVFAFLGYYWLLMRARTVTVSLIAFVTPLVAILIGVLLFDEQLSVRIFLGAAMILSGIVLVVKK